MNHEAIAHKIKALLSKTVEHGATEAEAVSAAEKARDLMAKYRLTLDEIEAEAIKTETVEKAARGAASASDDLFCWVGRFCDCQPWRKTKDMSRKFTGRRSDVMFATWLLDALDGFCARRTMEFAFDLPMAGSGRAGAARTRELKMASFRQGLVDRLNERLKEIVEARPVAEREAAKRANAVALAHQGVHLTRGCSQARGQVADPASYGAGRSVGDGAAFNRPVGGGARVLHISG